MSLKKFRCSPLSALSPRDPLCNSQPYSLRNSPRYSLISIAIAQALCCALASYAQTAPPNEQTLQEVIVNGKEIKNDVARVGGFADRALLDTPLSITVFDQKKLQDLAIRQTTDAMKFDASVNDAYNAVGYSEQFSIRGFLLDNASAYRKDGFAIPGDASIPLENKERVEILKGIAGFQAGLASPGGIINYVTKRPTATPLHTLSTGISERGTAYVAVDLSAPLDDKQFAYRINAAGERLRSYVKGANGERQFVSAAFDWHISPQALLQIDADYQHKSQLTAPGFQLTDGVSVPRNVSADLFLNDQPWAKPVDTRDSNLGLRFEYQLDARWRATLAANKHEFKRDDFTAFPYGCSTGGFYPGYCANGDYDVYDYQSVNESKSLSGVQAFINGKIDAAGMQHQLTFGVSNSQRRDYFGDYVYDFAGISNIFHPVVVPQSANTTGPILLRRTDIERAVFAQDVVTFSEQWQLDVALRQVHIDRAQRDAIGYERNVLLPSLALTFKPQLDWSLYGAFTRGLEHGGIAPVGTMNATLALDPARSTQIELGGKAQINRDLSVTAALFRIKKPLEYTNASNVYVSSGNAEHTGIELSADGRLDKQFAIGATLTALNARQYNTGDASIEGKRVTNVPKTKSTVYLDYAAQADLHVNATWLYASSKAFSPDNQVTVPGYSVFNIGARYDTKVLGAATTLRLNIDNLTDKFYWRDVTQSLGGYLLPGAPRLYKLSAQFDF